MTTKTPNWIAVEAKRGWCGHAASTAVDKYVITSYAASRTAHADFWVLYAETMPTDNVHGLPRVTCEVVHVSFMQRAVVSQRVNGQVVAAPADVAKRAEAARPEPTAARYTAKRARKCTRRHCAGNGRIAVGERYAARTTAMYSWVDVDRACAACCRIGATPR